MKRFFVLIERTAEGYKSSCEEVGFYVAASTFMELKGDINQAMREAMMKWKDAPSLVSIKYIYDLPSFFDTHKIINAAALAKQLGMSKSLLSQYVRGDKKPSAIQTRRILDAIQNVGRELADIELILP